MATRLLRLNSVDMEYLLKLHSCNTETQLIRIPLRNGNELSFILEQKFDELEQNGYLLFHPIKKKVINVVEVGPIEIQVNGRVIYERD